MEEKNRTYAKLYKKVFEDPILCKDSDYFFVWCYLLANATCENQEKLFNGKDVTLVAGQLITSSTTLSNKLKISKSKIQRILKDIETNGRIDQKQGNKSRIVTVRDFVETQLVSCTPCALMDSAMPGKEDEPQKTIANDAEQELSKANDLPKKQKHKYGEYLNVLLSDEEMEKLKNEFPHDWEWRIENLSGYIASSGRKYKSHLATIRVWSRKEGKNVVHSNKATKKTNGMSEELQEIVNNMITERGFDEF